MSEQSPHGQSERLGEQSGERAAAGWGKQFVKFSFYRVADAVRQGPEEGRLELFYRKDPAMMAVEIETEPVFRRVNERSLFEKSIDSSGGRTYDVTPDGKFVVIKQGYGVRSADTEVIGVDNWFEELKRRAPVEKN